MKRPEAKQFGTSFFSAFAPTAIINAEDRVSKEKGHPYIVFKHEKTSDAIGIMHGTLSDLQNKNPKDVIYMNAKGLVAQVGEECTINPAIKIQADDKGKLSLVK